MEKGTALPKNIRQIGEIRGKEKICMEDYVMTYIRKKEPQEEQGYLGIFLGERRETEEGTYMFIRGILEVPFEEETEEKTEAGVQEKFLKQKEEYFPDWEIQGCCVIGMYQPRLLEQLAEFAPEAGQLIYHLQEQEETLYWRDKEEYRRLKGYFVFYERNSKMQAYLAEVFRDRSVEQESLPDQAIRSFREKIREKGEKRTGSMLRLASSFFVVTVLIVGAIAVNRIDDIRSGKNAARPDQEALSGEIQQEGELFTAADFVTAEQKAEPVAGNIPAENKDPVAGHITAENKEPVAGSVPAESKNRETESSTEGSAEEVPAGTKEASAGTKEAPAGTEEAPAAAEGPAARAEASSRAIHASYVIRPGDTLADICSRYYGSLDRVDEICSVNNIDDANMIMPGQKIVLP